MPISDRLCAINHSLSNKELAYERDIAVMWLQVWTGHFDMTYAGQADDTKFCILGTKDSSRPPGWVVLVLFFYHGGWLDQPNGGHPLTSWVILTKLPIHLIAIS